MPVTVTARRVSTGGSRLSRALQAAALMGLLSVNLYGSRPYYNWDVLGYVGVAYRLGGASPEAAHERAYRSVRETVPAEDHRLLTEAGDYRQTLAREPRAFHQQLPFYGVKPAYPLLILGLERVRMNPVQASFAISRAAYLAIGVVVLLWLGSFLSPVAAVASAWGTMSLPFAIDLARLSTPDALSTLLVLTALWLVFQARRFTAGALVLLVSLTARPDNVLWLVAIAGFGAVRLQRRRVAAAFVVAGIVFYVGIAAWSGTPAWRILFHHSFVERLAYPADFEPSLTALGYLRVYLRQSHPVNLPPFLVLYSLIGAWLFVSRVRRQGPGDAWVAFLAVMGLFAASHWLVYPAEERFLAAAYVAVTVLLVRTLAERAGGVPVGIPPTAQATVGGDR